MEIAIIFNTLSHISIGKIYYRVLYRSFLALISLYQIKNEPQLRLVRIVVLYFCFEFVQ